MIELKLCFGEEDQMSKNQTISRVCVSFPPLVSVHSLHVSKPDSILEKAQCLNTNRH